MVYRKLFEMYPNPVEMSNACPISIAKIVKPLGLYNRRSKSLIRFSNEFVQNQWSSPSDLHGCGKYADDSYRVFCQFDWNNVTPTDHALNDYVDWARRTHA